MNIDLNNLSPEDKRKYIVYGVFGTISLVVLIICIVISGKNSTNLEVTDIDAPTLAEIKEYNNRLEAMDDIKNANGKSADQRIEDFFGNKNNKKNKETDNKEIDDEIDKLLADLKLDKNDLKLEDKPKEPKELKSNYNPYGNKSMYMIGNDDIPNNNNNISNRETVQKPKTETEEEKLAKLKAEFERRSHIGVKANSTTFRGNIAGNQKIKSGQTIRIQTEEEIEDSGLKIPKNTFLFGVVEFKDYRATINITNINLNGSIYSCNLKIFGLDGMEGLPISIDEALKSGKDEVVGEIARETGGIAGTVGRVASNVFKGKAKETLVTFMDTQEVLIVKAEKKQ